MRAAIHEEAPKPGFAPHAHINAVTAPWEPIYACHDGHGDVILAIRVGARHCNRQGILHGGVLAALADNALGLACAGELPQEGFVRTIGLSVDYLAAARQGAWVEFRTRVLKRGRLLAFARAEVLADEVMVAVVQARYSIVGVSFDMRPTA